MDDAGALRAELADHLLGDGVLRDSKWLKAFRAVPRHEFLPRFYRQLHDGDWEQVTAEHPDWLELVYADRVWVTQFDGDDTVTGGTPTCSSSMPTIMAIMLEALDVHKGQKVLEVGTGTGLLLPAYPPSVSDVTAIDIDPEMLARARHRRPGVSLLLADVQQLPFPDASFDAVVACLVFCSVEDPARGLAELRRVLRPGRYAVLIVRDAYQAGRYVFTGADLAARAANAGFTPKGDLIWYQAGTRLRPYGYPTGFVPNIAHQHLLVLRRG